MKQCASFLFPVPEFIGLLMDLDVIKTGFRHLCELLTRRLIDFRSATGHTFPRPIPTRPAFLDRWKDVAKPLNLRPPVTVADPRTRRRSWPVHTWARYIPLRPPLVNITDWGRNLTFIVRTDAYLCADGCWTPLSFGLLKHGKWGHRPAYLWGIGIVVCGDKDTAALATIWAENPHVLGAFVLQ